MRTRGTLGDALVELMQEKSFDEITVQQVLDRAGVGRSTFYAHYRDKDDLFLSDVEDFFGMMSTLLTRRGASLDRVAPVAELFAHIAEMQEFYKATVASGKVQDVLELGQDFLHDRLRSDCCWVDVQMEPVELKAMPMRWRVLCFRCWIGGSIMGWRSRRRTWTRCFTAWCGMG